MKHRHLMRPLVGASLVLALVACSSGTPAAKPIRTPVPATTSAPSPAYDKATLDACTNAMDSSPDPDDKHAEDARSSAALSDVPTLREIAAKYARGTDSEGIEGAHLYTAKSTIAVWCLQHGLGGLN